MYFLVLGGLAALAGVRGSSPIAVQILVTLGCLLGSYRLAVLTVAWWRTRTESIDR
jgi:hypothetical protein